MRNNNTQWASTQAIKHTATAAAHHEPGCSTLLLPLLLWLLLQDTLSIPIHIHMLGRNFYKNSFRNFLTSPLYGKLSTRMQNSRSFSKLGLGYRKYDFFHFVVIRGWEGHQK